MGGYFRFNFETESKAGFGLGFVAESKAGFGFGLTRNLAENTKSRNLSIFLKIYKFAQIWL